MRYLKLQNFCKSSQYQMFSTYLHHLKLSHFLCSKFDILDRLFICHLRVECVLISANSDPEEHETSKVKNVSILNDIIRVNSHPIYKIFEVIESASAVYETIKNWKIPSTICGG